MSRTTVSNILSRHGITPSPSRSPTWADFLAQHWDVLAATDFFTVELWRPIGLVRHHVLFVIQLATRRVTLVGITQQPDGGCMAQLARNLTDGFEPVLPPGGGLIHDRDPLFTLHFRRTLAEAGVQCHRLPSKSPNLNAFAERFVLSIKAECLNRLILFSEAQLRRVVNEYLVHYHLERNHQGVGNKVLDDSRLAANDDGSIECRLRLGGLLRYYHREVA